MTTGVAPTFNARQALTTTNGSGVIIVGNTRCQRARCEAIVTSALNSSLTPTAWQTITLPNLGLPKTNGANVVSTFQFATPQDGLALFRSYGHTSITTRLLVTTDGGHRWRALSDPNHLFLEATFTSHALVALTGTCSDRGGATACSGYELLRRSLATGKSQVDPLVTPTLPYPFLEQPSLAAEGSTVAVTVDPTGPRTAMPRLFLSQHGSSPYADLIRPALTAVTNCTLEIRKPAIWATCPTGMLVSELHADTLTGAFTPFWTPSGTFGDDTLAPVSAQDAYRLVTNKGGTNAALELTTDGGHRFRTVTTLEPPQFAIGGTSLKFVSLTTGFLTISEFTHSQLHPAMWGTINAGRTWTKIYPTS
ncbi:MAG: hypothetical protein MP439_02025 [Ferrimicrobium sp.]|jgi:hypothetical protein|nr:hypothetical protein [Ferrimicrobium sp.]